VVAGAEKQVNAWWQVDLGGASDIQGIEIWNRAHSSADVTNRLSNFYVFVSDKPFGSMSLSEILDDQGVWRGYVADAPSPDTLISLQEQGQYVRIQLVGKNCLTLAEVKVFGGRVGVTNLATGMSASQSSTQRGAEASRAVDGYTYGDFDNGSVTLTVQEPNAWWQVDLGETYEIQGIEIWNSVYGSVDATNGSPMQYYFEDVNHPEFNSGWISQTTWQDSDLEPSTEYCYRVKARNSENLLETQWSQAICARTNLVNSPTPNPMTWAVKPNATSESTIRMTATTATSGDGSAVEYYFENVDAPEFFRDWDGDPSWERSGLNASTEYCYRVKARNSVNLVETQWSPGECATTWDPAVPTPNPMTWSTEPYAVSAGSIRMTATTATPTYGSGVQYYFKNTTITGHDSGWQSSATYVDAELSELTEYCYKVKARNTDNLAETEWSELICATTPDVTPPSPNPMQWEEQPKKENRGGTFDWWVVMTAGEATDPSGVEYKFVCTSESGFSSGWQDTDKLGLNGRYYEVRIGGQHVIVDFQVKARDKSQNKNETQASSTVRAN